MWVERRASAFDVFNYAILVVMSACFLYPVVMTLALSFSDADKLGNATVGVWPVGYSLNAYRLLLSDDRILRFYLNTINYAGTGTLIMLVSTSMMAYPLTFRDFRGGKLVAILLVISLFFSGGLVPTYLVVLKLGLVDTMWALVLPAAISAFNVRGRVGGEPTWRPARCCRGRGNRHGARRGAAGRGGGRVQRPRGGSRDRGGSGGCRGAGVSRDHR